ncbi:MAG TPA: hypothetical protein VJM82_04520 [Nitrospiraceae bacterium]|nr:hypothetical protein [Nitrospiraceae bacterium]
MIETLLVLSAVLAVGVLGLMTTMLTPHLMTELGFWMLTVGLIIGVPAGLWYHVVLYRALAGRIMLPPKWWIEPVALHPQLAQEDMARIKPWFRLGGIGFALSLAGGLAAMAGLLLAG